MQTTKKLHNKDADVTKKEKSQLKLGNMWGGYDIAQSNQALAMAQFKITMEAAEHCSRTVRKKTQVDKRNHVNYVTEERQRKATLEVWLW